MHSLTRTNFDLCSATTHLAVQMYTTVYKSLYKVCSPLALHLAQADVDLCLLLGQQFLLHVGLDASQQERSQHLHGQKMHR